MDKDRQIESVFTKKIKAGRRRTYFFDVRKTKGDDFYISVTESTKRFNGDGYDKHKIFIYKEDFNRFLECLQETVNEVKTNLLPDFDYEAYSRREEEWKNTNAESNQEQERGSNEEEQIKRKEDRDLEW